MVEGLNDIYQFSDLMMEINMMISDKEAILMEASGICVITSC